MDSNLIVGLAGIAVLLGIGSPRWWSSIREEAERRRHYRRLRRDLSQ